MIKSNNGNKIKNNNVMNFNGVENNNINIKSINLGDDKLKQKEIN